MANALQESILASIETLLDRKIDTLDTDKTVTAVIDSCANMLENKYMAKYQGGLFACYAQDGTAYTKGQAVYVLVPENDFSNKKIIVGLASSGYEDSGLTSVSSAIDDYNVVGTNAVTGSTSLGLYSYKVADFQTVYENGSNSTVSVDWDAFKTYVSGASAIMLRAKFNTANLSKEHRTSKSGNYGVILSLSYSDRDAAEEDVVRTYVLDTHNMVGDPFQYSYDTVQYAVFPIDFENLAGVEGIYAFSEGFVDTDDAARIKLGADIFVKDVELYALSEIDATSGDYRLKITTPKGTIFSEDSSGTSSIEVDGKLVYQSTELTDQAMFYWFKEDGRVTSTSSDYSYYGGAGWSLMEDAGHNYRLTTLKSSNRAYENKYMCVCAYKESVVLKTQFTVYNESERREVAIDASPSTRFSFDRGEVSLTCTIDGKSSGFEDGTDDALFTFCWSKVSDDGTVETFTLTEEEVQKLIDEETEKLASGTGSAANLVKYKNLLTELSGVDFYGNRLTYPVKGIETSATFKCSVFKRYGTRDYLVGSAQTTVVNEDTASPDGYRVVVENGDQVFQYSESGVSPCDSRYADPLEVKPLICHFYDPAGLEVSSKTYSLKWQFPVTSSLLVKPSTGVVENPSTGLMEWIYEDEYTFSIADSYDYLALDNQVTAIVVYDGIEYRQQTDFLFVKVGDNGTNGTDIVAKVEAPTLTGSYYGELPYVSVSGSSAKWMTGASLSQNAMKFRLFNRNTEITSPGTVSWAISPGTTRNKNLSISSSGNLSYSTETSKSTSYSNQNVRGSVTYESNRYYAFYPVPVVKYSDTSYRVVIDRQRTLKDVLYNSDGRNPLYNTNQGVFFKLYKNGSEVTDKTVTWETFGGSMDVSKNTTGDLNVVRYPGTSPEGNQDTLSLGYNCNASDSVPEKYRAENEYYFVYVVPNESYSGEWCNNMVHASIPGVADIYVPVHMYLNTYGLASLNQWDGNHIEINEDSDYIMAPQIGAGVRDSDNRFTGLVMGASQTYDQDSAQVGLLGYSAGEQSIFMDAYTGNTYLGLPAKDSRDENGEYRYTEGRIELVPGGTSKIGNWKIGSDFLYNVIGGSIGTPYDSSYKRSIPHDKYGVMLSSDPAYVSIKGRTLTQNDLKSSIAAGTNIVEIGDTFELELNPSSASLFTIYRHTQRDENNVLPTDASKRVWRRTAIVGIDSAGRFYTNSIKDEGSALTLNYLPAFGYGTTDKKYRGVNIEIGSSNTNTVPLVKFFASQSDVASNMTTATAYISGGSKANEYIRPLVVLGKTLSLYANGSSSTSASSDHRLQLADGTVSLGHYASGKLAYIELSSTGSSTFKTSYGLNATVDKAFSGTVSGNSTVSVGGTSSVTVSGNSTATLNGTSTTSVSGDTSLTVGSAKTYTLTNSTSTLQFTGTTMQFGNSNYGLSGPATGTSGTYLLKSSADLKLWCSTGNTDVITDKGSTGIRLQAKATATKAGNYEASAPAGTATLLLTPSSSAQSSIKMVADNGVNVTVGGSAVYSYQTTSNSVTTNNSVYGISLLPGIQTNWGHFAGTLDNTNFSIVAYRDIKSETGWVYADKFVGSAVSLTGTGLMNSLSVGSESDNKAMDKSWFDAVQDLYNNWGGGNFPANLSNYVTYSSLSSTLGSYAQKGTITVANLSTSGAATINQCATAINLITKQVNALLGA
jgi:hypothetical protein